MKGKQFIKRLRKLGIELIEGRGKGGHCLVKHGERWTTIPVHGDVDFGPEFLKRICKQLGVDPNQVL